MRTRPMRSGRRMPIVVMALFSAVVAAACGNGQQSDSGTGVAADATATEAVVDSGTPTEEVAPGEAGTETTADPGQTALAESCQETYDGATLDFVVPYSAGGGYDTYARMVAPYVQEELGATVVVKNEPGAGGLLAINNLLAKEGEDTTIAMMNGVGSGGAAIAGAEGAAFELDELSYVARLGNQLTVMVTGADSGYETMEDVIVADSFRFASSGPGGSDFVTPTVLIDVFDLNAEIVTGYDGSSETELAVIRGDVDAMTGSVDSRISAIENGEQRPVLMFTRERIEELPDTPAISELESHLDDEDRRVVSAQIALTELGRPVVAPPGIPEESLSCLREAFARAVESPDLIRESEETGRPIDFLEGAALEELVTEIVDAPPSYEELLRQAYRPAG